MKSKSKRIVVLLFGLTVLCIPSIHANYPNLLNFSGETRTVAIVKTDLLGAWQYTVDNAPLEYRTGVITITDENGDYAVQVQLTGGVLLGENVTVDANKINFNLLIEGDRVSVVLTADGDTISGTSTASDGVYSIEGKRVKS
ncbi:MAG: hypothetical protein HKN31_03780 [Pricia sp.]|nr:hypothetical protein [Pricia sp.]